MGIPEIIVVVLIVAALGIAGVMMVANVTRSETAAASATASTTPSAAPNATTDWFASGGATITLTPSLDTSTTYASGIVASTGGFYARIGKTLSPGDCTLENGTAPVYGGPLTDWGGHSETFPPGGFSTAVDIYLDVPYAIANPDTRFDWSTAISDMNGRKRRKFVFNVGTDARGFVMSAGNNATRCAADPSDPGPGDAAAIHIAESGWYTFKHTFKGDSGEPLSVTLTVASTASPDTPLGTWTLSEPSDIVGTTVGGNNDGSFIQNEFDGLAIDNAMLAGGGG